MVKGNKQISMKYAIRPCNFLLDMLLIMVPTKISMKHIIRANHFLVDVSVSNPLNVPRLWPKTATKDTYQLVHRDSNT